MRDSTKIADTLHRQCLTFCAHFKKIDNYRNPPYPRRGDSRDRGGEDRGRDGGAGRASRRAEKNGSLSTVGIDYCSCYYGRHRLL